MSFALLALICVIALAGPLLALPRRVSVPVVFGQLIVGIAFGATGTRWLDARDPTFTFLAEIGFALVMFIAGTHVPVRDAALRHGAARGLLRAAAIGLIAVPAGWGVARLFDTGNAGLYAVLIASSSAAIVMPALADVEVKGRRGAEFLVQIAIADAACIIALPLILAPQDLARAALGVVAVLGLAAVCFLGFRVAERSGAEGRLHKLSKRRRLALELRVTLILLFGLAAVAVFSHVSVMLAGFALGVAVAGVREPKRLSNQVFALAEGLFAPIFFVWLGASLDLRVLAEHPEAIGLGVTLGVLALVVHALGAVTRQPLPMAVSSAAQLGVPVAAAAMGRASGALGPGEDAALLLGAMVTLITAIVISRRLRADIGGECAPAD